ncbi:sigma factor-like helix-turn-helix DNA-binding protein [Clostridium perfringens]|uniref:sigma factor-like helix-turn-helix DNA-binding protein n=1 Tax=Clostridium perfringens TaxID=1502 RepID=UPI001A2B1445|nr:sigma factor-like helix-turn-helix DNA-binding protein [Clostridium perfringens]MDB2053315.1 sigma factor-like helix-turn-helix DNA-binding protein [Clostridium perfringens]MDK0715678.1 sigma factor-like helix-turn-helix DNA-binding protein [Clostridium perfringens]MDM0729032.1 sigma factor-like helix-turn-helix DNA-binding protein [Clostridium perfringens]MDU4605512.1 sigma factor-like helix-turn-helix DNA-binding protein [Clostridium perfringens]MDU4829510.1 sigma factor-like helix-turn-h
MNKEQKGKEKRLLSNYKTMKSQIECIDYEIELLEDHIEFLKGLRDTENSIIESNNEIERKRAIKKRLEDCINSIDNALNELSDTERKIVELRYLEVKKHTWKEIGDIVGYSSDYCRKEVLNKILNNSFNILFNYRKYK